LHCKLKKKNYKEKKKKNKKKKKIWGGGGGEERPHLINKKIPLLPLDNSSLGSNA